MWLFDIVTDLHEGEDLLRGRRYGVIEVVDGRFRRVVLRPFPKLISAPGILLCGGSYHRFFAGDRLWLYYNQPRRFPSFLALKYVVSARQTTMGSLSRALAVLDEIARIKQSDALLCDVGNWRITTKLIARWGWVPHCPSRWHRHYIKRLYPGDRAMSPSHTLPESAATAPTSAPAEPGNRAPSPARASR
ncbi:MAG: hypothetical protein JXB62_12340 [Pirellulales bacterium]|nr:hypothetical protein [Pirellulales bacterium]